MGCRRVSMVISILAVGFCLACLLVSAQQDDVRVLKREIQAVADGFHGVMGVSLKHMGTGETVEIRADERFPTASTIKIAVMCEAFRQASEGRFGYYDTHPYNAEHKVGGAGFLQQFKDQTPVEMKEALHFMITASDNTATDLVLDWIGGLEPVNSWLKQHGFSKTRMLNYLRGGHVWDKELNEKYGLGVTTPNEMRRLLEMILTAKAGSPEACDEMLRLLGNQYFDGGIPSQVPPTVQVLSKGGAISSSRSDCAIVCAPTGTYILVIYTRDNEDKRWTHENEAEAAIRRISRIVWRHYNPSDTYKPVAPGTF